MLTEPFSHGESEGIGKSMPYTYLSHCLPRNQSLKGVSMRRVHTNLTTAFNASSILSRCTTVAHSKDMAASGTSPPVTCSQSSFCCVHSGEDQPLVIQAHILIESNPQIVVRRPELVDCILNLDPILRSLHMSSCRVTKSSGVMTSLMFATIRSAVQMMVCSMHPWTLSAC